MTDHPETGDPVRDALVWLQSFVESQYAVAAGSMLPDYSEAIAALAVIRSALAQPAPAAEGWPEWRAQSDFGALNLFIGSERVGDVTSDGHGWQAYRLGHGFAAIDLPDREAAKAALLAAVRPKDAGYRRRTGNVMGKRILDPENYLTDLYDIVEGREPLSGRTRAEIIEEAHDLIEIGGPAWAREVRRLLACARATTANPEKVT